MTVVRQDHRTYVALIGDIRGSREAEDRAALQDRFESALNGLNEELSGSIVSRLVVTTGDEFQGLFDTASGAVQAMVGVADRLADVPFTFGIGHGGLDTQLRPEAVGMDGPCFHRARAALEAAQADAWWASAQGFGERVDAIAWGLLGAMGAIRSRWTAKQTAYVRAVRGAATQREVAERFGVSPSVVSESLSAARFEQMLAAEASLVRLLEMGGREAGAP